MKRPRFVLVVKCPDVRGIVAETTRFLVQQDCSIVEAHQHQDGGTFYMRLAFNADNADRDTTGRLERRFAPIASRFEMDAHFHDLSLQPRVLLMVSKFGHCLFDLLNRWRMGQLPIDIAAVISNHEDMRSIVEWHGLSYYYLPVTKDTKTEQERRIVEIVECKNVELIVLARYMQILSPDLCAVFADRCINIHHSFLPSFKGAKPYHQAYERGVKVIGATAHYVTTDLDEGPIIEQDTRRINHARSPEDLVIMGQEIECSVLARAVQWHIDRRVMRNGSRTVVFE